MELLDKQAGWVGKEGMAWVIGESCASVLMTFTIPLIFLGECWGLTYIQMKYTTDNWLITSVPLMLKNTLGTLAKAGTLKSIWKYNAKCFKVIRRSVAHAAYHGFTRLYCMWVIAWSWPEPNLERLKIRRHQHYLSFKLYRARVNLRETVVP